MLSRLIPLIAVLAIAACAPTYGTKISDSALSDMKPGKTTYADAVAELGPPSSTGVMADGSRVATYTYLAPNVRGATYVPVVGLFAGGSDMETKTVSLVFDQAGVLKTYQTQESKACSGNGVFSDMNAANCQR